MGICVEIEIDDQGKVTVGVCPPEEESGEPKGYMEPAQSVEDAIQTAKDLLTNPQAQQAAAAPAQPAQPAQPSPEAAAAQSFGAIRGGPQ